MPQQDTPPVTQRAYTLQLRGRVPNDSSWRTALWQTHEAVNKGVKSFGDWLLTLRGGLDHTLADRVRGKKEEPEGDLTLEEEERKARRILLALSWLSVESKLGAPQKYIIAFGDEVDRERNKKVLEALEEILKNRGLGYDEIAQWKEACKASLSAEIRDDAVWVNRSKAFDDFVKSLRTSPLKRNELDMRYEVWDMLNCFFESPEAYLKAAKDLEDESFEKEQEEQKHKAKDLVMKAGQWLSSRFGTGKGANFCQMAKVYEKIEAWADNAPKDLTGNQAIKNLAAALVEFNPASEDLDGVLGLIKGPGYKSATRNLLNLLARKGDKDIVSEEDLKNLKERAAKDAKKCSGKKGSKGSRPYSDKILEDVEKACGFTYLQKGEGARHSEFAVMLDHAARRVSQAQTWIKRAEAERRRFEEDSQKGKNVPDPVREWLNSFCSKRSDESGSLEAYRIRRRAVEGWKEAVEAWSKSSCKTCADRIAAVRALQDNPEIDKFGDIQLFEALAEDDAVCVWHKDGDPNKESDYQPLIDYVLASEAEFKKKHFKVPAYRHPDALLHPVFCDFGKSRWRICFGDHKNPEPPSHGLQLKLWDGSEMTTVSLRWQSKRLTRDLALGQNGQKDGLPEVARADRFGRTVANVSKSDRVKISGPFQQENWNGRLQAPRLQLESIAKRVCKHGWDETAKKMRDHLQWLVTFSARLQPQGPWCEYAEKHQLKTDPRYWPHADANKNRKGHARLILSRLPGLRVLSVDLGHRYAAACAVWEALSTEKVKEACQIAGHKEPEANDLYLHLKRKVTKQKKGNQVEVEETAIYRRIGADKLPDGTPHPAPWCRLDRQFLIKLQGEKEGAREASNHEIWAVHRLESDLGRTIPLIDRLVASSWGCTGKQKARLEELKQLGWSPANRDKRGSDESSEDMDGDGYKPSLAVDELMFSAVRTMRLALKHHGDRARLAFAMTAEYKSMPGDRRYYFREARDLSANDDEATRGEKYVEFIQDALVLWHGLVFSRGWRDDMAKELWDENIAKLPGYKAPEEIGEESSGPERKKKQKENREKLKDVAKSLAQDVTLREALHDAWKKRWKDDDEWLKIQLRWFKDWVLPRGKHASDPTIRKVGGLSLLRLVTLTEFRRKVQVGFLTRLRPDGTRGETKERFGQRTLDALEHLCEQRVKQLASRIVEAAIGAGSEDPRHWDKGKRPPQRIDDPRFAPCHAIVIEDLTRYRPEQTRTRRENRMLMTWSSAKVKNYLAEACQLHGLLLREVSASYTSRQDSRTGAPGTRCQDVPVKEFMQLPFWRKQVSQARKKLAEGKGGPIEQFLSDLNAKWENHMVAEWKTAGILRIPLAGGEVFVSADPNSPAAKGLQADLNAAANIGLRALTDPDWPGKWWYVPCDSENYKPIRERVAGSAAIKVEQALCESSQVSICDTRKSRNRRREKGNARSKGIINLWRDISALQFECGEAGEWKEYGAYQKSVEERVIGNLKQQGEKRDIFRPAGQKRTIPALLRVEIDG